MSNVLIRVKDILSANVNTLLHGSENPMKEITNYIREVERDLGKVKGEAEAVIEEEKRLKREINECKDDIDKLEDYAELSVLRGKDDDAVAFLSSKSKATKHLEVLEEQYELVQSNSAKMKVLKDKIENELRQLNEKRDELNEKLNRAKNQEKMNDKIASIQGVSSDMGDIDDARKDIEKEIDKMDALEELNKPQMSEIDELMAKYDDM